MSNKPIHDTHFTNQVKQLLGKLYGRSILKDSLLERAISYYDTQSFFENRLAQLKQRIDELKNHTDQEKVKAQITKKEREYREFQQEIKEESDERQKFLAGICAQIIELSEGKTFEESNRKSAQLLGTIQLLSPTEGKKIAEMNECNKPLYRAVLCLRLLDRLSIDRTIVLKDSFISEWLDDELIDQLESLEDIDESRYQAFIEHVKIPVVMAALIQDIGHFHQDAQQIVKGVDGAQDPFRTLPVDDRKALLQINYRETMKFLIQGVGAPTYIGNSKADRDLFNVLEHKKLVFIKRLLKSAITPKNGIGNLIKVPQIYASIILSTKSSYNYKLLPKVYKALNANAERGTCCQRVVDALHKITGDFPQGFGVTYIPTDSDGKLGEHYEYAIVNSLYPNEPLIPHCRTATRNLAFMGHGQDIIVTDKVNLYNTETAQQFASVSKERLNEILVLLSSNYQERKELDLLPRCWHPGDYFSMKNNQNLWNKTASQMP